MLDIIDTVEQWRKENRRIALATVVKTWGSAPRREGSKLAITDEMAMIGSVSGGCVENAVIEEALDGLQDGKPRLLTYGVSDDTAWEVGLTCGGKISIFVEPLDSRWWETIVPFVRDNRRAVTSTILDGQNAGNKAVFDGRGETHFSSDGLADSQLRSLRQTALNQRQSGQVDAGEFTVMVDVNQPRPHLIIVGGVHVAMPLTRYAHQLGFIVSIVDPRSAFATTERFPDVKAIRHDYPDKALPALGLDRDTYLAVLTHDPKIDDPALITALNADVPYIGVLSSQRTHDKRVGRLKEAGINDEQIERIRTPIGMDIGAISPEEIALCIMAEIIAVRNGVLV